MNSNDSQHGAVHAPAELVNGELDINSMTDFNYFLEPVGGKSSNTLAEDAKTVAALDVLGEAMIDQQQDLIRPEVEATPDSTIPPIFTYWSQFIDHELTKSTDKDKEGVSVIEATQLIVRNKSTIIENLQNARTPFFDLDAVYGTPVKTRADNSSQKTPNQMISSNLAAKLRDGAKMRIGMAADVNVLGARGVTPPPAGDLMRDLPRVGQLNGILMAKDFTSSSDPFEEFKTKAFIGDPRNDENLVVAQFHVAILRFHNAVVDWLLANDLREEEEPDELFERARTIVRWNFQWLVINEFLPAIANPRIVGEIERQRAQIYQDRFDEIGDVFMPLEFSVAAYRFGHSMIRNAYDFNRNFGRPVGDAVPTIDQASLNLLFAFTGNAPDRPPFGRLRSEDVLPSDWIIEWDRFLNMNIDGDDGSPKLPARAARKIDTKLAPPLGDLFKEESTDGINFVELARHLARRNLRRGYVLNIPTGQAMAAEFGVSNVIPPSDMFSNFPEDVQKTLRDVNLDESTPLWYYILREAEINGGNQLGELGTRIVAETFIGLMVNDPESYLHKDKDPEWHPGKPIPGVGGPLPLKRTNTKIRDLLKFAGVM